MPKRMIYFRKASFFIFSLTMFSLVLGGNVFASPRLSDEEWEKVKVRILDAPYDQVWRECLILLDEKGFSFSQKSKKQGILITSWLDTTSILSQFGTQLTTLAINDFVNVRRSKGKIKRTVRVSFFFKPLENGKTEARMNLAMKVKLDDFQSFPVVNPEIYDSLFDEVAKRLNIIIPHVYEDLTLELDKTLPSANVVSVIDGDTLKVRMDGKFYIVQVLGADAPEMKNVRKPKEYFARESRDYARKILKYGSKGLSGSKWYVYIEKKDVPERSSKDRTIYAHIFLPNGTDYAQRMIQQGYAKADLDIPFEKKMMEKYEKAQALAQKARRGLWKPQSEKSDQ